MGKEAEKAALSRGHKIISKLDDPEDWSTHYKKISQADMVIDFSTPDSVLRNIRQGFDIHLPLVVGTTGWSEHTETVKKWCLDEHQGIFVASNFSIGMNLLMGLTRQLARALNHFENFNITLEEIHHIHKVDTPSGSAIRLADIILSEMERKKKWVNGLQQSPDDLQIISVREDEITGMHTVNCESEHDRLSMKHEAKNRQGFAVGAILAAEWLKGKSGYYEMKDLLNFTE